MRTRPWTRILAGVVGTLALSATPSLAESWPQRMVRFIVPGSAGTSTDIIARIFADRLTARWGHPVIVEDRLTCNMGVRRGALVNL
jgi:tripartite-type tricarboxylate transporter receptor subunit TctC